MKVKYFPDTDTAYIEFKDGEVFETKEICENVYIDVDQQGNIVNRLLNMPKEMLVSKKFPIKK